MTKDFIFEKLQDILEEELDLEQDEIQADSRLIQDLGLTSMDILSIISSAEKAFAVKIPERLLRTFVSVQDVVDCIFAKAEEKA